MQHGLLRQALTWLVQVPSLTTEDLPVLIETVLASKGRTLTSDQHDLVRSLSILQRPPSSVLLLCLYGLHHLPAFIYIHGRFYIYSNRCLRPVLQHQHLSTRASVLTKLRPGQPPSLLKSVRGVARFCLSNHSPHMRTGQLPGSVRDIIDSLFASLEREHGQLVVQVRMMLTATRLAELY